MAAVTIKFRNKDAVKTYPHEENGATGAYTRIAYTQGFVCVHDAWGTIVSFPADTVESVIQTPGPRGY